MSGVKGEREKVQLRKSDDFKKPETSGGRPVNFITPVKFVTCRKNVQEQAIFTFK